MFSPDQKPIYGPIESNFERIKRMPPTGPNDEWVADIAASLQYFWGTSSATKNPLLPVFGVIRHAQERRSQGEPMIYQEVVNFLNYQRINILKGPWYDHYFQLEKLEEAYTADRIAIDRALDFEKAKKSPIYQ